ncbi:cell wall anchor protein [Bacteroidota bacterium]
MIFVFFLANTRLSAQEVKVRSVLDSTHMLIGDQLKIKLEVEQPQNYRLRFPLLKDTLTDKLEVLEVSPIDTIRLVSDRLRLEQSVLITSFDSGFYVIPSFTFIAEEPADTFKTNLLGIDVLTIEVDTTKGITDIKQPFDAPLTFKELLPYIIAGIILIITAFFIGRLIYRARKKEPLFRKIIKPAEPPHIIAIRELNSLKSKKLWQQDKVKLYYSNLTEIIRIYIEGRFQVFAMEQTTDEILDGMREKGYEGEECFAVLQQILLPADLVKFAKWRPLPDDNQASMNMAFSFVDLTKRKPETENDG